MKALICFTCGVIISATWFCIMPKINSIAHNIFVIRQNTQAIRIQICDANNISEIAK